MPAPKSSRLQGDGTSGLTGAVLRTRAGGATRTLPLRHLFLFIGADPNTGWLKGCVDVDDKGFVVTGSAFAAIAGRAPLPLETSMPGVFAIGDVRAGSTKRVGAAIGEGAAVVAQIHQVLSAASLNVAAKSVRRLVGRRRCASCGCAAPASQIPGPRPARTARWRALCRSARRCRAGLHQIAEQADHVIAHRGHRQPFHRGLQAQLQAGARVHRLEQIAVLLLELDVDARAQQVGGARQLFRQVVCRSSVAMQVRMAGCMRRARNDDQVGKPSTLRSPMVCRRIARSRYRRGWRRSGKGWPPRPLPVRRQARSVRRAGGGCRSVLGARASRR